VLICGVFCGLGLVSARKKADRREKKPIGAKSGLIGLKTRFLWFMVFGFRLNFGRLPVVKLAQK
jgi:hypothetical protein